MDGLMDFLDFLLTLLCVKARGGVGGTRRTCSEIALARGSPGCRDAGAWEAFEFSSANHNPLCVLALPRPFGVGSCPCVVACV